MSIYPFSTWFSDASFGAKILGIVAIVLYILFVIYYLYCHQKGISLIKAIKELIEKIANIPNRKNSNQKLPVTLLALSNKADNIESETYPANTKDITALTIQDSHFIGSDCTKKQKQCQSQQRRTHVQ